MATSMRAKLVIESVNRMGTSPNLCEELTMRAVSKSEPYSEDGSDENNTYAKFSPSASLRITITNPALIGQFNPGETFYVDFTPIE